MKPPFTSRTRSWNSRCNSNPHTSPKSAATTNPSPKNVQAILNPARPANAAVLKAHRRSPLQSFLAGILWFGPRREHSSVPAAKSRSSRAQGLSRLAASSLPPEGLGLDGAEHGGILNRTGAGGANPSSDGGQITAKFYPLESGGIHAAGNTVLNKPRSERPARARHRRLLVGGFGTWFGYRDASLRAVASIWASARPSFVSDWRNRPKAAVRVY